MTDHALDDLIAAVEAGGNFRGDGGVVFVFGPFLRSQDEDGDRLWSSLSHHVENAYNGSIDAAMAFGEGLFLRIAHQANVDWGPSGCGAEFRIWPDGLAGREVLGQGYDNCPARALLVAILRAHAQEAGL